MALSEGTRAIIKEVAREVMCEYKTSLRAEMDGKVRLHAAECESKKYGKLKTFASGIIGGGIVAFIAWLFRRH